MPENKYVITSDGKLIFQSEDELRHWSLKSAFKKFKPKYYTKIKLNNKKYRYFYTKEEYLAYMNKGKSKESDKSPGSDKTKNDTSLLGSSKDSKKGPAKKNKNSFVSFLQRGKKSVSSAFSKTISKTSLKRGKKTLSKILSKPKSVIKGAGAKIQSLVKNGKNSTKKVISKIEKKTLSSIENTDKKITKAKNKVSKALSSLTEPVKNLFKTSAEIQKSNQEKTIEKLKKDPNKISGLDVKKTACSKKEDQEQTNPKYDDGSNYAYSNNCAYATAAYDLRQRGYDVEAAGVKKSTANDIDEIASWYAGEKIESSKTLFKKNNVDGSSIGYGECSKLIEEDLLKHGEGARGHFCLYWRQGGGHDVIWEVENGEVVLRDCQTNKTYEVHEQLKYAKDFKYFRTDNVELNDEVTKTVVNTNKKKKKKS